jgi:hypothetical protein
MSGLAHFDVSSDDRELLVAALRIAMKWHGGVKAWSTLSVPDEGGLRDRLFLHWTISPDTNSFLPATIREPSMLQGAIEAWLEGATYPDEPDTDGTATRGWRVRNDGDVTYRVSPYIAFAVEPAWIVYGK